MTKTTKTSQVTQSESLEESADEISSEEQPAEQPEPVETAQKEPAEIQAAAGGRPTPLTHESPQSEPSAPEAPKQQEPVSKTLKSEQTKLEEAQPVEAASE